MGGVCSKNGGEEGYIQDFVGETTVEDPTEHTFYVVTIHHIAISFGHKI